jgi:hypothetical protein
MDTFHIKILWNLEAFKDLICIHLPVILQPTKMVDDNCLSFNDHEEKKTL